MAEDLLLKTALIYRKKGFSVMPVKKDKKPYLKEWKPYQTEIATEEQIKKWWQKWPHANIGIITGKLSNLTVIDLDSEKAYQDFQKKYLSDSYQTPIAKSPKGYHLYCNFFEGLSNKTRILDEIDIRSEGGYIIAPPSSNGTGSKYKWIVKALKSDIPISFINICTVPSVPSIYRKGVVTSRQMSSNVVMFENGRRDEDLFHTANCLVKGFMPENEIRQVLEKLIISWGEKPSQAWINSKVESALKRDDDRSKSFAEEMREFILSSFGVIKSSDCLQMSSSVVTRADKKNLSKILSRLCDEGIIERYGDRNGQFRRIENKFKTIQLDSLDEGSLFDIRLPFGIEQYLEIMPKDLIVFAGVPNAGKTAIMLETCRLNMRRYKCFYFSSEMGAHNCKRRISKHDSCTDWPFEFVDDFPNFVDIIQPDNINFIDYIEETEGEAYRIPGLLAKIQRKLKNGIAVVALQKNPDKEYAIGGHQTKAKPALYCTIDSDYPGAVIRIVKAKNYREENPNGYMMRFKIVKGIILIPEGTWRPEV
uniref:Putative bifunctional DNA primase/polymerase n=1 Tax=viral metagenome TaxID=1070528 RepID=A0A6M3L8I2_9ZZZZ